MVFLIALADGLQPFSNACGFDVGQCGWNGPRPAIRFHVTGRPVSGLCVNQELPGLSSPIRPSTILRYSLAYSWDPGSSKTRQVC
jgi:hypothetical protein